MNRMTKHVLTVYAAVFLFLIGLSLADAQVTPNGTTAPGVTPGQLVVEPPTLINLGFEWYIDGDAERDSYVTVQYRKTGTTAWTQGMNMLRIQNEVNVQTGGTYTAPNMFAGSVLDLEANTSYDVMLTMNDPDGVNGNAVRKVTVKTRAQPEPYQGGHIYNVYPIGYTGTMIQPAFAGLLDAYYTCESEGDGNKACPPRVVPGDTIMVHAGTYGPDDPYHYSVATGQGTTFDGTYYFTAQGTAAKPISIVAAGDGPVIFDGGGSTTAPFQGNHNLFNVMGSAYNYFEGLTLQNTDIAFWAGIKDIAGAVGLTVKHCTMQNVGFGVWNEYGITSTPANYYIADNTLIGRENPNYFFGWFSAPSGVAGTPSWQAIWNLFPNQPTSYPAPIYSYIGIKLYGQGNVVAYNNITRFHDGMDIDTHGVPEGYPDQDAGPSLTPRANMPVANDFYNNDVHHTADNCFETDGSMHNMRVLRTRCANDAGQATSSQPTFAGPTYFIRNVTYNCPTGAIKFSHAEGSLFYNNTFTCRLGGLTSGGSNQGSNFQFVNNLILGQNAGEILVELGSFTNYSILDYNGYRPNDTVPGLPAPMFAEYNSPPFNVAADYTVADLVTRMFPTFAAYQQGTGQDAHSILIDWNVFQNAAPPQPAYCLTASGCTGMAYTALYPSPAPGTSLDLTLNPSSAAVDAGVIIPNVTDGYTGGAPDLGAYEVGLPLPHYGPRNYPLTGPEVQYD